MTTISVEHCPVIRVPTECGAVKNLITTLYGTFEVGYFPSPIRIRIIIIYRTIVAAPAAACVMGVIPVIPGVIGFHLQNSTTVRVCNAFINDGLSTKRIIAVW